MKILYMHQYFNTPEMAGSTRSWEFAVRMARAGHEVHMITSDRSGGGDSDPGPGIRVDRASEPPDPVAAVPESEQAEPDEETDRESGRGENWRTEQRGGITIHWTNVPYNNRQRNTSRLRAFFTFAWRAARRARELGGDVVFASSTPLTIAIPGIYASRRLGVPLVFEVRDLWPDVPIAMGEVRSGWMIAMARRLERTAYRHAARIVALSPGMKEGVVRQGIGEEKIDVIPNSSDLDLFDVPEADGEMFRKEHTWLRDRPLVLYCGTLGRVNGIGYMVEIAREMETLNRDVCFLAVGEGREADRVIARARALDVWEKTFYWKPPVPKRSVPPIYSAATLTSSFVIDNKVLWANSANKFFDSLAASRPILINHEGWQADLIRETGAGLVVPPDDPAETARQIHEFLSDPQRVERAGRAARKLGEERFDRDRLADELIAVLDEAVSGHAGDSIRKESP